MKKIISLVLVIVIIGATLFLTAVYQGWFGRARHVEELQGGPLPENIIAQRALSQKKAANLLSGDDSKQILFGDLHVHTTFSTDAFWWSLPILGGEGVHPMADACDYARYCSSIDFWAITDHAEASTPRKWTETKDFIRQCSKVNGEESNDVIPFIGFEWTQVGSLPEDHYGHKNVIFKDLEDDKLAKRPIGSGGVATNSLRLNSNALMPKVVGILDIKKFTHYSDFQYFVNEIRGIPFCDENSPSNELEEGCYEFANTPGDLVRKLEEQFLDPLIIPHGSTWGYYTPPTTSWDKQLSPKMRPDKMKIIEVMSGHGNSEEYRSYRQVIGDINNPVCPEATSEFLPSCWQAGEIIRKRCLTDGETDAECEKRAVTAREIHASLGIAGHIAVSGENAEDWLDSNQCRDCFLPSFNHIPTTSVQYGLAITNFENQLPTNFKWGFIAASDNHRAKPGTGYKPIDRLTTTEAAGGINKFWRNTTNPDPGPVKSSIDEITYEDILKGGLGFALTELERQQAFWTQGGLAAVHVKDRSRDGIWDSLNRKEIYGTSGPRILLWFDEISNGAINPMGSELSLNNNPRFVVRVVGAFKQKPGCPEFTSNGLSSERIEKLCSGECYNPSSERLKITRVEIIKITPQINSSEVIDDLILDPWLSLPCEDNENGCTVEFEDNEFIENDREALYYVRAIQEPTDTINGSAPRCTYDKEGNCIEVNPCWGDYRVDKDDLCLSKEEHRAWSSPIFVSQN